MGCTYVLYTYPGKILVFPVCILLCFFKHKVYYVSATISITICALLTKIFTCGSGRVITAMASNCLKEFLDSNASICALVFLYYCTG